MEVFLRSGRGGVLEFMGFFFEISDNRDVEDAHDIVALQLNSTVETSCPIPCHFIVGFECVDYVFCVLLITVFDSKVVNH